MSTALTREIAPGYQIDLTRDNCGCTVRLEFKLCPAGTITIDPDTLQVDREYESDPIELGSTRVTTPDHLPDDIADRVLPALTSTFVVEEGDLESWLIEFCSRHFLLCLTAAQKADDVTLAANQALARDDADSVFRGVTAAAARYQEGHHLLVHMLDPAIIAALAGPRFAGGSFEVIELTPW